MMGEGEGWGCPEDLGTLRLSLIDIRICFHSSIEMGGGGMIR